MEKLPAAFLVTYNEKNIPNASPEILYKTQCRLVQQIGAILRQKVRSDWRATLARFEIGLRTKFTENEQLPRPVLKDVIIPASKKDEKGAACSQNLSTVDESPALTFDSHGNVENNLSCMARNAGLAVGSACCAVKNTKGIKRTRIGTVTSIGQTELTVTYSADGEKNLEEVTISCPLDAIQVYEPPRAGKKAKTADVAEQQPLAKGNRVEGVRC